MSLKIDMQVEPTKSFSLPSIDGPKLFQVKIGVFVWGIGLKPVFENKIGVFLDRNRNKNSKTMFRFLVASHRTSYETLEHRWRRGTTVEMSGISCFLTLL